MQWYSYNFLLVLHPPCRVKRVWSENKRPAISYLVLFYVSVRWSTCIAAVGCLLWLVLRPRYITKPTNAWYIATRLHWLCDLWSWSCEREIRLEIVCHTTRSCELRGLLLLLFTCTFIWMNTRCTQMSRSLHNKLFWNPLLYKRLIPVAQRLWLCIPSWSNPAAANMPDSLQDNVLYPNGTL